jgi:hypothetical protein
VPPSALLREILSLVLHEVRHMGGAREAEAQDWLREFSEYFGMRFGDVSVDNFSENAFDAIFNAEKMVEEARALAEGSPGSNLIFGKMEDVVGPLASYFNDPLAIELKAKPMHPDLIEIFSVATRTLHTLRACFATQMIESGVDMTSAMKIGGWKYVKTVMTYVRLAGADEVGETESLTFGAQRQEPMPLANVVNLFKNHTDLKISGGSFKCPRRTWRRA